MLHPSPVLLGVAALALLCSTIASICPLHLRQDAGTAPLEISRKTLFESETLQISLFEARDVTDACGDVERQSQNAIALPLSGVFSKHDAPGHHVIGTPSHAVFFAADTPYRIGFPGGIGDRAISLRFDEALAPEWLDPRINGEALMSNALLPAHAMMLRN